MNIVHSSDVPLFDITQVEGKPMIGQVRARKMLRGSYGLLIEVHITKGSQPPAHVHTHDSLLYVIRGKVKATVGSEVGIAEAGDAILHPAGIEHISEALEDSVWIEIKAPPEETW